jgi:hypothetical protein
MADKKISDLAAATLAELSEALLLEVQVVGLAAPESRQATQPQARFLANDFSKLAATNAATCTAAALFAVQESTLADPTTRNVRSLILAEMQALMNRRSTTREFNVTPKVGTTAGWVVGAANNLGKMATLPAGQAGSTLVVPLGPFKVGDTITAFGLEGSLQAGGNHATIIGDLRVLTAAAAGATDASVGVMGAALDVVGNTIMNTANAGKSGLAHVIVEGESFYMLITATTGAACTEELQAVQVTSTGS